MKKILGACILLATLPAFSEEINIYDSPSDKKLVVVEYCTDLGICHRLVTPKLTLEADSDKIGEWIANLNGEPKK